MSVRTRTRFSAVSALAAAALSLSALPAAAASLPAPTGLAATATSSSTIALSWSRVPSATGYQVLRSPTAGGTFTRVGAVSATTYTDTGLNSGTTYFYEVKATKGKNVSPPSAVASATTASAQQSTTTTVQSSANPSGEGQPVTFTATVQPASSAVSPKPTGTVTFLDGASALATVTIGSNAPQFTTSQLAVGTHPVTARYDGDANFTGSTSGILSQQVKYATTTTMSTSPNPALPGDSVTLTARVTGSSTPGAVSVPTGTVTFWSGGSSLGTAALDSTGTATTATKWTSSGSYVISAQYSGDPTFARSESSTVTETISSTGKYATATSVSTSANPSTVNHAVTVTAAVTSSTGTPSGSVTFFDGTSTLGNASLDANGRASISATFTTTGTHTLSVSYFGDATHDASRSAPYSQSVQSLAFAPYVAYPTGSWPTSTAIADVTGDGRNDVLMTTGSYGTTTANLKLFVFAQQPDGSLAQPAQLASDGAYSDSMRLATGDLTGDSRADVVVTTGKGLDIYKQTASGLAGPTLLATPKAVADAVIADVDGDARRDIVADTGSGVLLYRGNGDGTFQSPVSVTSSVPRQVQVADVTGDGRADVVALSGTSVTVYPQTAGGFGAGSTYAVDSGGLQVYAIATGDLTGDGRDDVVVTIDANRPDSYLILLPQQSNGTLGGATKIWSYDCPEPVVVADVDGDGRLDAVAAHGGWNNVGVWFQQQGTLEGEQMMPVPYASHYDIRGLSVGDVNGDGHPDIVVADYNNGLIVLRQQ